MRRSSGVIWIVLVVLVFVQEGLAQGFVSEGRCHRWKNPFQLNVANVNAIMAMACTALSHSQNERRQMTYEDSASLFHQWQTQSTATGIRVEGYCAIPLTELKAQNLGGFEIDLEFRSDGSQSSNSLNVRSTGQAAGRSVSLDFDHNEFQDDSCSSEDVVVNRVRQIYVGMGSPWGAIQDMLRSGRTGVVMSLMGHESWVQGKVSAYFSSLGLQYRMTQFNGRQLGLAIAPSPSGSLLHVRSANVLDFFEGGKLFAFKTDTFGTPVGFLDESLPTNGKFQAYPIANGSEVRGCTSLIYEGELSYPQNLDFSSCTYRMDQTVLARSSRSGSYREKLEVQSEAERRAQQQQQELRKIQQYLDRQIGVVKKYSSKPHVYETGRAAWTKGDSQRGWVIHQRAIEIVGEQIIVTEFRYDKSGVSSKFVYTLVASEIFGKN